MRDSRAISSLDGYVYGTYSRIRAFGSETEPRAFNGWFRYS